MKTATALARRLLGLVCSHGQPAYSPCGGCLAAISDAASEVSR